jgi:hypothetical protein
MANPCLWSSVTVTLGAVAVFFLLLGRVTRTAYLTGFAAGFTEARKRFERVIRATKDKKIRAVLMDEIKRSDDDSAL